MEVIEREVFPLELANGSVPFNKWLDSLDIRFRAAVEARIAQVRAGNFGDHRNLSDGVYELRIHKGPGLRVYYGLQRRKTVVLLGAGSKASQRKDIKRAKLLWKEFKDASQKV